MTIDADSGSDDGRLAVITGAPEGIAKYRYWVRVLRIVAFPCGKKPADLRIDLQHFEIISGNQLTGNAVGVTIFADRQRHGIRDRHRIEQLGIVAKVAEVRIRDGQPITGRSQLLQSHYSAGIASGRQRVQQDSANPTEDGGVRADPQGQSEDSDRGKAGIFAKHAGAIAQVLEKFFEPARAPLIACDLLDQREITEFAMCRTLSVPRGFATAKLVAGGHLQMGLQLLLQLLLLAIAMPETFHAWPSRLAGLSTPAMASVSCSQRERSERSCFFPVAVRR